MRIKVKSHLKSLVPYPPGKTVEEIKRELNISGNIYKFNSNESPLGPPEEVVEAIKQLAKNIHLYPEASYIELKKLLAEKWGVSPEQVVLGNGSDEVIEFVFKAIVEPEDEVIFSQPSFLMYEKFAEIYGTKIKKIPLASDYTHNLSKILENISSKTKVIFLDHPHNPTGSVIKRERWLSFLKKIPEGVLVVIDEAYGDFITDTSIPLGIEFIKKNFPVMVIRTFSKSYGLAGLRLGYGITHPEIAKVLDSVRQPFNLNILSYKAGIIALKNQKYLEKLKNVVKEGRDFLTSELEKLGFKVLPSQANFIMVDFGEKAEEIYQKLMKKGILLRPLKAYNFPNFLRISIGLPEANQLLVKEIKNLCLKKDGKVIT